ncbi:fibronectin type III domain-containing protein [Muricauda sp. 2012CJ35-5]|uniref:Fibronectin type III domain-containing protein n=1 Tax=Flagellimonas spongiicola TaxID=2942208 RepID=A0ABT0PVM1_9FLAO|nr:fibronectin type III domain-containing protein [Allomuricauda spongiicola]MCL6275430.1 fibronectin type III domain-containing protein [Allomuricauda spongiicola]
MKQIHAYIVLFLLAIGSSYGQLQNGVAKLINADTDAEILTITGNVTWDLNTAGGLNIKSEPSITVTRVRFILSNGHTRTEWTAPFAAYGDVNGDYGNVPGEMNYFGWHPVVGDLDVTIEYLNSSTVTATDTFTITFIDSSLIPTAPTVTSSAKSQTTVDLSWSGATDNVAVTGYKVFKDGVLDATLGNVSTYQVTSLSAGTSYDFTVTALDGDGNESPASSVLTVITDAASGGSSVWTESSATASYTGQVGVGVSSVPTGYKMAIDGKLITEEVRVELSGSWPDYVFQAGYKLLTLEEIKAYIEVHGHLPNIPSAVEVATNGLEVGEMNKLLLEKIEELTLHVIQLKAENTTLKNSFAKELEALKSQFELLKK